MSQPTQAQPHDQSTEAEVAHTETSDGYTPGIWDWTVVGISVVIVAFAFYLAIRYLFWPGERDDAHIKRRILRDESP